MADDLQERLAQAHTIIACLLLRFDGQIEIPAKALARERGRLIEIDESESGDLRLTLEVVDRG